MPPPPPDHPPHQRWLPLTLRQEVALAVFLAGAPLATLIAFAEADFIVPVRILVLTLAAVFALGVALGFAFQILKFTRTLEQAAERWRSGDLGYRIRPSASWSREFRELSERQNEMAEQLDGLYRREREIAVKLQALLVSPLPHAWGPLELADFYRAGSPSADVGGDFYALFPLSDGRLGLLFGDIGGKGLAAAVKIAGLRYALEAYAREDMSPAVMMARANEIICEAEFQIATLVYLTLDPDTGEAEMTNAGHEPPLFRCARTGGWSTFDGSGTALGVLPGSTYETTQFRFQTGDLLCLYTDGVASVGPKKGEWSTGDLLHALTGASLGGPKALIDHIASYMPPATDDAALVALRFGTDPGKPSGS